MKMNYSYNEMQRAFECGRNFQLTGENNFQELIEELNQPSCLGAVICRLSSPTLLEPLGFYGEPIYYKMDGIYGYIVPVYKKVLFFYSDADGGLFHKELNGWTVLNGI